MRVCIWISLLLSLSLLSANGQSRLPAAGAFAVGFRVIKAYDTTRRFDPNRTDSLRFRPVKIDLFYPAVEPSAAAALPYRFFFDLVGLGTDFNVSADSCHKVGLGLAQYWSYGVVLDSADALLRAPTASYAEAAPVKGRFPLIIYCPGYNGMSYENLALLEQLAAHGYVVAAVSSVGKYPGVMTMDSTDIIEQVQDARFALRYVQQKVPFVSEKAALVGYSWGGLAATITAMHEPDFSAVVSLDGSEYYSYGESNEDDSHFNLIRQANYFKPDRLRAPYLYLSSGRENLDYTEDSVFMLSSVAASASKYYVRLPGTTHEDFSYVPYLASQVKKNPSALASPYPLLQSLIISHLDTYVKGQNSFSASLQQLLTSQPNRITLSYPARTQAERLPTFTLSGSITDVTGSPIPYANIGIVSGNQGTVSDASGAFKWQLSGAGHTDTVRVSMIGYQAQNWPLRKLIQIASGGHLRIQLKPQPISLADVVVRASRPVRKTLGNATESKSLSAGFDSKQAGAQMGIRISPRKSPTYIEKVDFHISYNRYDSLTLRLNVYQLKNNIPTTNLMTRPVIARLGKQTGRITFDLADNPLLITSDVVVAIELLDGKGGEDRGVYLSAGVLNGSTYYRRSSQGNWRQGKGLGIGMRVEVQY